MNVITMLTGVSLSFCIRDLCENKVQIEQVARIITGTKLASDADFEYALASYKSTYWRRFPEQAEQLARSLWSAGKIVQPRLTDEAPPHFNHERIDGAPTLFWFVGDTLPAPVAA